MVRNSAVIAILALLVLSTSSVVASASPLRSAPSPVRAPDLFQTPNTITFTGNPAADFPADALLYTNLFTPWGAGNNLTGLYGTWDATNLYLGLSGVNISGNQLLFAVSNDSAWGTTNLSSITGAPGASEWQRTIDFTQPMNYLFIVNSSFVLTTYVVTSLAGSATTTVANITYSAVDNTIKASPTGGALEVAIPFTTLYPGGFPKGATVQLYAGIFGGSGSYVGPTIPSGQSYSVNYGTTPPFYLLAHDQPDGYLLENTFYKLGIDPQGLGAPDSGITPNYVENETFHSVTFTGVLGNDFAPGELALINTNTMYGGANLLNSMYITWDQTTLFLGFNASISGNNLYFFIGNNTHLGPGTYTLNTTNDTSINRPIVFTQAMNFIGHLYYPSSGIPSPVSFYKVTTPAATSNTSVTVQNETGNLTASMTTSTSVELAIPFNLLYGRPASWPVLGVFANISVVAAIVGGGGPSTGPTLPAGQGYAYTGYYNTNHTLGYDELLNTFFTENLDPYGDGVPALQINPTYTYGHTFHNVAFTGTPTRDFDPLEIVGSNKLTPWGSGNLLNSTYATWNYTDLFLGTNSTIASGNYFLVALSNGTGVGATNFSKSNVANLTRNFVFGTPVNFVFAYSGGAPNGSLYEVDLTGTTATATQFTYIGSVPAGTDGDEFAIPFSMMYPTHPSAAGADAVPIGVSLSLIALIYGGPGAYIGPTIPSNQSFSSGTAYAPLNAFVSIGIDPNKDGYAEPGVVPSAPPVALKGSPISLDIIFNDHQPLYAAVGGGYDLPWTVVHLEEYAEQALIAGMFPNVNITYSLSGSLLYQIEAVALGDYNNAYLQAAMIPSSQWGNSVYTEVTTYGDTFLGSFVPPYEWNETNVSQILEYNLAFNTPPWAYTAPTPASTTYYTLFKMYQKDVWLNPTELTNALVEYFLWSTSWPIETGQLGSEYINSTMWNLFNQTSFTISNINTIEGYYPIEAALVLTAFSHDRMLNDGAGGNVELITTPFNHPILPLLLLNNWTDENGVGITKGVWGNSTAAELTIGSQLYQRIFGQAPLGLWSPEQAVSSAVIPYISQAGYTWTSSSQATLGEAGISVPGSGAVTAQEMENLYTPYTVTNGSYSTVMAFRDDALSNDWGFNYGTVANTTGNWAAVSDFMSYLANVYLTIPRSDHASTVVTMALDGENWMFMSPFPEDGVPFLEDVYTALEANSSWVHTTTMQQYLATSPTLPTLSNLPVGSWNAEPTGPGINQYLGQWAGHGLQDATWQQLALVAQEVQAFGTTNHLTQPMTLATLEQYNNFPYLTEWNTSTLEGKYVEAWTALYGAMGSDIYFAFDPSDQSPTAQNALVFENVFRSDLSTALTVLGLPLTPFLLDSYEVPLAPTVTGSNAAITPVLSGSLYTSEVFINGGIGYSVNHNDAWAGAYVEDTGATTAGSGVIVQTNYAFDVSNLYFSIEVNGSTSPYVPPNFYTAPNDNISIYFSPVNPGVGNLESLGIPDAAYTVGTTPFGFGASTKATIEGSSVTPSGSATLGLFASGANGAWTLSSTIAGDAWVGDLLQMQVPMTSIGMVPGDSIAFFVVATNGTTGAVLSSSGPLLVSVPSALAKLTLISAIHNTAVDNGPGYYTYPQLESAFPPNSFDMQWVNVSTNPYTVQFNITFGNLSNVYGGDEGFSQPIINIYIHEPGSSGGNTSGLPGTGIDIASQDAWQWAIQASGYSADNFLESAATHIANPAPVLVSTNLGEPTTNPVVKPDKNVSIEVPTSIIGSDVSAFSYVIIAGSQDGYGIDGWRIVDAVNSTYQGGGSKGSYSSNVYSYISPAMVGSNPVLTQQDLLANYSSTSYATLVGIQLPLITTVTTHVAVLGASAIVNTSGDPEAFYAVGSQLYSSTSPDGKTWAPPVAGANLSFVVAGMAAVGGSTPGLLAWNGTSYAFENVGTGTWTDGTASAAIEAAGVTEVNGAYLLALDIGGTVEIGPPATTFSAWGTDALSASAVGFAYSNGTTFVAYTTSSALDVAKVTVGSSSATFNATPILTASLPSGWTVESLSLVAAPSGAVAVALDAKNASGSNVYVANGTGTVSWKTITTDGADFSPSVLLGTPGGVRARTSGSRTRAARGTSSSW